VVVPSPPVVMTPAPYEVSFGRVAGRVSRGTQKVIVSIDGRVRAERYLGRANFDFRVALPPRDIAITVTAVGSSGRRAITVVRPVFGLPTLAAVRGPPPRGYEDQQLARTIRGLARTFAGVCSVFVQDVRSGAGAAWYARAKFPAASTLKVAIAIEVLRLHPGKPTQATRIDRLLRRMLIQSDSKAANELLVWLGGSISGGSARVNSTIRALGLIDTDMRGGYAMQGASPIPLRSRNAPTFVGKITTAWDYARLLRYLHLAAEGEGRLPRRFRRRFAPAEARFLLYLLVHAQPNWLNRDLPRRGTAVAHKAGWLRRARHDGGLVYGPHGVFLAVVMTWNDRGAGVSSEVLAGRVAKAAYAHFEALSQRSVGNPIHFGAIRGQSETNGPRGYWLGWRYTSGASCSRCSCRSRGTCSNCPFGSSGRRTSRTRLRRRAR
jgi:beta-lactamase class A